METKPEVIQTESGANQVVLKNILVATDLSAAADKAMLYAALVARRHASMLFVVHVVHPNVYPFQLPDTWALMEEAEAQRRERARQDFERTLHGIPHEIIFRRGPIWKTLSSIIQKQEIDLVVLGTHGRTGLAKLVLGSVAEEVFRQASCPVLTVGPTVCTMPGTDISLKRILYATDFSSESLTAAPFAVSFALENDAQLILLHCACNPEEKGDLLDSLRDVVPIDAGFTKPPICMVASGSHTENILDIADLETVDLIVLGVRAANWRLHPEIHCANSTAYRIASLATCPVLTVRG